MLVWAAQIAATVQVCESSFSEVGEIASDGPEARYCHLLLPRNSLESEFDVRCTDCGNRAGM